MPEIGGLYYRQSSPYDGFPCYRHDMNKTFIIRFDRKLPGWVLDTNNFDGDIIASRRGMTEILKFIASGLYLFLLVCFFLLYFLEYPCACQKSS